VVGQRSVLSTGSSSSDDGEGISDDAIPSSNPTAYLPSYGAVLSESFLASLEKTKDPTVNWESVRTSVPGVPGEAIRSTETPPRQRRLDFRTPLPVEPFPKKDLAHLHLVLPTTKFLSRSFTRTALTTTVREYRTSLDTRVGS
jgi:hypothetical protein